MKTSEIMREQIFEIIRNQIKDNNPPETNETLKRLLALGYTEFVAKQHIGQCIAVELFDIIKNKKPFDLTRYITHLKQLPKEPFDDEESE